MLLLTFATSRDRVRRRCGRAANPTASQGRAGAGLSGCGAATINAAAGSNTVSLAGGRIARDDQCLIGVNLAAPTIGSYTISTGVIRSSNSGASSGASPVLRVAKPVFKRYVALVRR